MTTFEIIVIVFLYLIWAQRSKLVSRMAMWLTVKRRLFVRKVRGA